MLNKYNEQTLSLLTMFINDAELYHSRHYKRMTWAHRAWNYSKHYTPPYKTFFKKLIPTIGKSVWEHKEVYI